MLLYKKLKRGNPKKGGGEVLEFRAPAQASLPFFTGGQVKAGGVSSYVCGPTFATHVSVREVRGA